MGAWFQSILVRTENSGPLEEILRQVSKERDVKFLMGPPVNGWISVFPGEVGGPAELVAQRSGCDIFHLQVHDDDVFTYDFFRNGKLMDRYNSDPGYGDDEAGEDSQVNEAETAGNPELFQDLLPDATALGKLKIILQRDRRPIYENERMSEFVELLGLENALSSYKYFQGGETDGIEGPEKFVHIEERPGAAEDYCRRGVWKREAQNYLGALEDLNQAVMLKPELVEAYIERARVREELRRVVSALKEQLDSSVLSARAPMILKEHPLGTEQGNLEAALMDYEQAIALAPDQVDALVARARLKLKINDLDGAMRDYDRIIELRPDIAKTWSHRGQVKRKRGDMNGALADYTRAVELEPGNAQFHNNRGLARKNLGDLAGARVDLDRAVELNPELVAAWFNRALLRRGQKDRAGALADLDQIILLKPDSGRFYQTRAELRLAVGDTAGSLEDYKQAVSLEPGFAAAEAFAKRGDAGAVKLYIGRAEAHRRFGNYDAAIADCNKALQLDSGRFEAMYIRAEARQAKGDLDSAMEDFDRACQLKPDSATLHNGRGLARQAKGDLAGAIADFKRACELKPDWAPARDNLDAAMRVSPQ